MLHVCAHVSPSTAHMALQTGNTCRGAKGNRSRVKTKVVHHSNALLFSKNQSECGFSIILLWAPRWTSNLKKLVRIYAAASFKAAWLIDTSLIRCLVMYDQP